MTTVVVARKGNQVAIGADTLVTFGDTRLSHRYEVNTKVFEVGGHWFGLAGSVAHFQVLRKALASLDAGELRLSGKEEIFATFNRLHPLLKEHFFLQTKEDEHDPYESSQFTVLIANDSGIYGVYSYREIFEFRDFWAIGSGRNFALGAMHAAWGRARTAREVAQAGLDAGCEFDKNSAGPLDLHTLKLKGTP